MGPVLLVAGVIAITAGVYGLAGPWWALVLAGTACIVGAVLHEMGTTPSGKGGPE